MNYVSFKKNFLVLAEIQRLHKESELSTEKTDRQRESLNLKLQQTEKDLQLALKQEQQAHEEDVERITKEKVRKLNDHCGITSRG